MATVEDWTADDEDQDDYVPPSLEASVEEIARQFRRMANSLATIAALTVISFVLSIVAGIMYWTMP